MPRRSLLASASPKPSPPPTPRSGAELVFLHSQRKLRTDPTSIEIALQVSACANRSKGLPTASASEVSEPEAKVARRNCPYRERVGPSLRLALRPRLKGIPCGTTSLRVSAMFTPLGAMSCQDSRTSLFWTPMTSSSRSASHRALAWLRAQGLEATSTPHPTGLQYLSRGDLYYLYLILKTRTGSFA